MDLLIVIAFSIGEADVLDGPRCSKALRIPAIRIVRDRQWRIKPINRVSLGAEKEESAQFGVDVVCSKLHAVVPGLPREVIPKLKFPFRSRLWNVYIGADLDAARKSEQRISSYSKDRITEILEMK